MPPAKMSSVLTIPRAGKWNLMHVCLSADGKCPRQPVCSKKSTDRVGGLGHSFWNNRASFGAQRTAQLGFVSIDN